MVVAVDPPVTAGGGVITPPEGYWERVQEICKKYNILLHIDEVVCGLGRTGTWFGYQHYGIKPDIVTMAKGVASGYAAISCTVTTEEVFEAFKGEADDRMGYFRDISTFGGCTAGPAAALENMRIIEDEGLLQNTIDMGDYCLGKLGELMDKHRVIGDVRGKGLMVGLQLDRDCPEIVQLARAQGVLVNVTAGSVVRLLPPLVISEIMYNPSGTNAAGNPAAGQAWLSRPAFSDSDPEHADVGHTAGRGHWAAGIYGAGGAGRSQLPGLFVLPGV